MKQIRYDGHNTKYFTYNKVYDIIAEDEGISTVKDDCNHEHDLTNGYMLEHFVLMVNSPVYSIW